MEKNRVNKRKHSSNTEEFVRKAKEVHQGENLDYSKVIYINNRTKVCIIDPEYGEFWQTPSNHLKGQCHPSRRAQKISDKTRLTTEQVVEMFRKAHPNENLDYSQVVYRGMHEKVKIICRDLDADGNEYGEFWQEANSHLRGHTHPRLMIDRNAKKRHYTTESFIEKCRELYPDETHYSFDKVDYVKSQTKVIITCHNTDKNGLKHGNFEINPDAFLQGKGCPKCAHTISKPENEIYEYVSNLIGKDNVVQGDRTVIKPYELDIYIPSLQIAIEYDGLLWHSSKYRSDNPYSQLEKTIKCSKQGVILLHIFEDEYLTKKELVLDKIANVLGCNLGKPSLMARKCSVTKIDHTTASSFLNKYHIQGHTSATVYLGAHVNGQLVAVMTFKREDKDGISWNLTRYATDIHYRCQGMASKLFSHFIKTYNPNEVKSFLDRRWADPSKPSVYERMGFEVSEIEKPDYRYTKNGGVRLHKFGFRKQILHRKYGFPLSMTETEMTEKLGYYKVYDCGLIKYIWKR